MSNSTRLHPVLDYLAADLHGSLVRPGDPRWDTARKPWNVAVDQQPLAVATPRDVHDVTRIVAAARAGKFGVTVQPRGHGAAGDCADCILVRTSAFDEITINVADRVARVGSGISWGTLLARLEGTGLIALAGSSPDVSVTGYLLSGGHSWFSRWQGLAAHSLRAVELVDGRGDICRVTPESNPELLWALRGGGGLFGVVTTVEIDLFEAPELFGGRIVFAAEEADTVLEQVAVIMANAPNELSIFAGLINMPDIEMVPEPMRGHSFATVDVVFVGGAERCADLLAPLLTAAEPIMDQTRAFGISRLGEVSADPDEPVPSLDWGATLTEFTADTIGDLVAAFRAASADGLAMLQLRPLGGALRPDARGNSPAGVAGSLSAECIVFAAAFLMDPSRHIDDHVFDTLRAATAGKTVPRSPLSLLSSSYTMADAVSREDITRLAEIKRTVDPDGLMRSNVPLV
ncbi:FAD-binding oxidoreductase [Cryobacterium melibiosiphilum]|nr:FAD-binding oxidoreductase [Cryobacterium melibiosiphilum]